MKVAAVTEGERGMIWSEEDGHVQHLHALHVPDEKVIDTSGAGDVFHGAYLASYLRSPTSPWAVHFDYARAASAAQGAASGQRGGPAGRRGHHDGAAGIRRPSVKRGAAPALLALALTAAPALLVLAAPAYAWFDQGHETIAAAAWAQLTPQTRGTAARLLRLNPDYADWTARAPEDDRDRIAFVRASTWADDIKRRPDYERGSIAGDAAHATDNIGYADKRMHAYWHFIDLPFSSDGSPAREHQIAQRAHPDRGIHGGAAVGRGRRNQIV